MSERLVTDEAVLAICLTALGEKLTGEKDTLMRNDFIKDLAQSNDVSIEAATVVYDKIYNHALSSVESVEFEI